jgi:hypothetical protein
MPNLFRYPTCKVNAWFICMMRCRNKFGMTYLSMLLKHLLFYFICRKRHRLWPIGQVCVMHVYQVRSQKKNPKCQPELHIGDTSLRSV